jgi:cytochrome b561
VIVNQERTLTMTTPDKPSGYSAAQISLHWLLALLGFFALHVLGALYQQFVLRTDIMVRMSRPRG